MTDEAIIKIKAGDGGDGIISFRREKYVPKGGPDGGDGGKGGDIYLVCEDNMHALTEFTRKKEWEAKRGENGRPKKQTGAGADDLEIKIPPGTIVKDLNTGQIICDLTKIGDKILIARGGKGGQGNVHFATAVHQAPLIAKKGIPGEAKTLKLELKLIADVGLIGLPNVGKSTLLSSISNARPKIADYPFTTLEPNLGVAKYHDQNIIFADIPGLIDGASKGKGLGDAFLRHIERTKVLVHLIDINSEHLKTDYETIRHELREWNPDLIKKPEIIVLNKMETMEEKVAKEIADVFQKETGKKALLISAVSKKGINILLNQLIKNL